MFEKGSCHRVGMGYCSMGDGLVGCCREGGDGLGIVAGWLNGGEGLGGVVGCMGEGGYIRGWVRTLFGRVRLSVILNWEGRDTSCAIL